MLEDQRVRAANIQQDREFVKTFDTARDGRSSKQMDDHGQALAASGIQECVLYVLGDSLFHEILPPSIEMNMS